MSRVLFMAAAAASLCSCAIDATEGHALATTRSSVLVESNEALIVTETAILDDRFSLERVLGSFASQLSNPNLTARSLYARWWDLQNDAAHVITEGTPCSNRLNGFSLDCPRQEGMLAAEDPFDGDGIDDYQPIALVNRFDLAPADGANCGEYRIVYGKTGGGVLDRNLIIFEPKLPNPQPALGLEGCRPIAQLWASLPSLDLSQRASLLERLYFDGLPGFRPVIDTRHFTSEQGQIRTNQFMTARDYFGEGPRLGVWQLREFKLRARVENARLTIVFEPVTDQGNPFARLFNDRALLLRGPAFREHFLTQVASLSSAVLPAEIAMEVPDEFNSGQSNAQGLESNIAFHFARGRGGFASEIQSELDALGSSLTPTQVVRRAMTTTCAGCHQLSNGDNLGDGMQWPASLGFVHVSERQQVPCDNPTSGNCFAISPGLRDHFLPDRRDSLEQFLAGGLSALQGMARVH